jgi:quercetin dioxygenase-like cupin family protein
MDTSNFHRTTQPLPLAEDTPPFAAGWQSVFPQAAHQDIPERQPAVNWAVDFFGTTLHLMTLPEEGQDDFCVLRGVIPPGSSMPLHSHPDQEDVFILFGEGQLLKPGPQGYQWITGRKGQYFHVPRHAPHAWRNVSGEPLIALIITSARLGRFFQEIGRPVMDEPHPVTPEELAHVLTVAATYGHWIATPEEHAAVGIRL